MSLPVPSSPSSVSDDSTPSSLTPRTGANGTEDPPLTPATSNVSPADSVTSSWKPNYDLHSPPDVTRPYKAEEALGDLPGVSYALEVFLSSHMLESEEYCHKMDVTKERLYFATGYGLIQCVKGLMSYEDEDLLAGINHTKHGNHIASQHRKKQAFLGSRLAGYVVSHLSSGVSHIRGMTPIEQHAELVYAESLFEKALLGIVYSGDWLAFIKEALNMRTTIGVYRQLGHFLDVVDAEATARDEGPMDQTIDSHFRSGVYLGVGLSHIILSLMPGKLMTFVELFGYHGDRKLGLETLMKAGGWTYDKDEPEISAKEEGVRRTICDMVLLIFHLVLSSFTFDCVDITVADKILKWNLKRYPNGVFFLFGAGRLALCRSQPAKAVYYYTKAMESQKQYRNLHHISFWEIAIANLALWDIPSSLKCWTDLKAEATWSKAIYSYGMAVCLLEVGDDAGRKEAAKLLDKVPDLRQKIAGKSIPLEKFVARKARKFSQQGNRLALPALELAYIFLGIAHAPRDVIINKMLPEVENVITKLETSKSKPKKYSGGHGYWDDYCLAQFLKGVCLRYVAYPDPDAIFDPEEVVAIPNEQAAKQSQDAFRLVLDNGPKIELDHHIVYHTHYELGRLLACEGKHDSARHEFELVISGKYLEVGPSGRKGKYSMENALHMRCHAALDALHQKRL
ncbi:Tetratricopeptide repeat protein 39B [Leucoagaricus sp. SymC.cos]|nr:Tetratricopeptide repeat protein 39B [Leucoagaricus sp. SymC.cos]